MNLPLENAVCKVQMDLANNACVGQDELYKVVSPKNWETPKQDIEIYKTDDYKEPDYIEADNESHRGKIPCELFCVTEKDLEFIDIDSIFGNDKMVI